MRLNGCWPGCWPNMTRKTNTLSSTDLLFQLEARELTDSGVRMALTSAGVLDCREMWFAMAASFLAALATRFARPSQLRPDSSTMIGH